VGQTATDKSWWLYPATAASTSYTPNALNQYSAIGTVTLTYDGNSDLTYDGTYSYCYDAESRLTGIISAGTCASPATTVATYAYNAQGRRKSKTVGSATTNYITDADNREVLEYNGTSGSGAVLRWYSFGLGPDAVLNRMSVAGTSTRATLIPDIQGSLIGSLDAASGTLTKTGYQLFGENPTVTSSANPGYYYTGRRLDAETAGSIREPSGLYYYRARMYSPTIGRFLQPDPVGYSAGTNLYAYVHNDPLNKTDPSGLCDSPQGCGGGSSNQLIPVLSGSMTPNTTAVSTALYATGVYDPMAQPGAALQIVSGSGTTLALAAGRQMAAADLGVASDAVASDQTNNNTDPSVQNAAHYVDRSNQRYISAQDTLDALAKPLAIIEQDNGNTRYEGVNGVIVILNPLGEFVTVYRK
jgi:RHS repeat-associated protein